MARGGGEPRAGGAATPSALCVRGRAGADLVRHEVPLVHELLRHFSNVRPGLHLRPGGQADTARDTGGGEMRRGEVTGRRAKSGERVWFCCREGPRRPRLRMSPVERWRMPNSCTMSAACVPLPAAGGPLMITLSIWSGDWGVERGGEGKSVRGWAVRRRRRGRRGGEGSSGRAEGGALLRLPRWMGGFGPRAQLAEALGGPGCPGGPGGQIGRAHL